MTASWPALSPLPSAPVKITLVVGLLPLGFTGVDLLAQEGALSPQPLLI